jgi:hypothetical protein
VNFKNDFTSEHITEFLSTSSVPTLIDFSEEYIDPIFGKKNPAIFLFSKKST